jgi:hypothetical protein
MNAPDFGHQKFHSGLDFALTRAAIHPIGAAGHAQWYGGYNTVIVDHGRISLPCTAIRRALRGESAKGTTDRG